LGDPPGRVGEQLVGDERRAEQAGDGLLFEHVGKRR